MQGKRKITRFNYTVLIGGLIALTLFGGFLLYSGRRDIERFALISCIAAVAFASGPTLNVSHRKYTIVFVAFVVVTVCWTIFFIAKREAEANLRAFAPVYRVVSKEEGVPVRHIVLLRTLEKGMIVHDPVDQRVEFIRWETIAGLSRFIATSKSEAN